MKAALSSSQNLRRTDIASGHHDEPRSVIPAKSRDPFCLSAFGSKHKIKMDSGFRRNDDWNDDRNDDRDDDRNGDGA